MWPASAGHTHSGRSGKVDFCVLRVFRVKKYRAKGPREGGLAGEWSFAVFSPNFGLGTHARECVQAKFFSQLLRRQTSSDRSYVERRSESSEICRYQNHSKPVRGWLTANVQKKKYFCFSNRLFLQSRSPRVGRVGRSVFRTTVFGIRVFHV